MGALLDLVSPFVMYYVIYSHLESGTVSLPHHEVAKLTGGWPYVFGFAAMALQVFAGDVITTLVLWYMLAGFWRVVIWVNRYLPACYSNPGHAERTRQKEWFLLFLGVQLLEAVAQLLWGSALQVGSLFTTVLDHNLAPEPHYLRGVPTR
jgi:hypothetical protein